MRPTMVITAAALAAYVVLVSARFRALAALDEALEDVEVDDADRHGLAAVQAGG